MNFEDFEGFKRIKNNKNLTIENIYEILKQYQDAAGEVKYASFNEELKIVVDVDGKYYVDIYLSDDEIIIERKLEEGHSEDENTKSIPLVHADRMIEQIYDLLVEYIKNGKITEHITKAKEVLMITQEEKKVLFGIIPSFGKKFIVKNENGQIVFEIKENVLNKSFSLFNLETKREEAVMNYSAEAENKFTILKHPFENVVIRKNAKSSKIQFVADVSTKKLKISGDYTENHFMLELNEVVIGSVDSIDPLLKKEYRVEINEFDHKYIVLLFAIIADIYSNVV